MPPPGIEPATPCVPACPSNYSAIVVVDNMLSKLLQFLFTIRYSKKSVWFAKGYIENKNTSLLTYSFVIETILIQDYLHEKRYLSCLICQWLYIYTT